MAESKVVLITGGSSGLGRSIGRFLAQKGFRVYGTTRDRSKYADFKDFTLLELDVRDNATIETAMDTILREAGRIDVLINNAGVGITGAVEETPYEAVQNVFEVNFNGPIRMIKAVMPQMRNQGSGLVINITSIAGFMGLPFRGYYSASKGALELVTESLRMEAKAFGIKFCSLAPGDFATNIAAGRYHVAYDQKSPYAQTYKMSLDLMNEHVDAGGDPMLVAKKVAAIINSKNPKGHYAVGAFMQKLSLWLKRLLPGTLFESLLVNHYKL